MIGTPEAELVRLTEELPRRRGKLAEAEKWLPVALERGKRVDDLEAVIRERQAAVDTAEGLIPIYEAAVVGELDAAGVVEAKARLVDRLCPAWTRERTTIQ